MGLVTIMHYKSLYNMQPHVSVVDKEVTDDMTLVLSDSDVTCWHRFLITPLQKIM